MRRHGKGVPGPDPLRDRYGPERYSENQEEWIIRDFFKDRRDGFFVDVGANRYKIFSNTYCGNEAWLDRNRRRASAAVRGRLPGIPAQDPLLRSVLGRHVARQRQVVHIRSGTLVASSTRDFTERWGKNARQIVVPTITLNDLLEQLRVRHVDLLSIDVELSEPKVLAGFDVEKYKPSFVCIEAHPETRQRILDYFAGHR